MSFPRLCSSLPSEWRLDLGKQNDAKQIHCHLPHADPHHKDLLLSTVQESDAVFKRVTVSTLDDHEMTPPGSTPAGFLS